MDAITPPRPTVTAATTQTSAHAVSGLAVTGNNSNGDTLHGRATAEPEPAAAAGDGDNTELRPRLQRTAVSDLSDAELSLIRELRARDRAVRSHEMAHLAAAGAHARGGPSYTYDIGPDNRRYAVGGEVQIDTSPVAGDPAATLAKARQVRSAALAPASPSAQDRQVAAAATAMAAKAQAELVQQRQSQTSDTASTEAYQEGVPVENVMQVIDLVA